MSALFTVIMPMKSWDLAKSRLHVEAGTRRELASAFARDTLEQVLKCPEIDQVIVVTGDETVEAYASSAGAKVIREPSTAGPDPLGAAVRQGVAAAPENHPVAVIPADLPALTSDALGELLAEAADHRLAFVPDTSGGGTTILTGQSPATLQAGYGVGSAERHRSYGAFEMQAPPGLRRDVDEFRELLEAQELGLGPHTALAYSQLEEAPSCA